MFRINKPYLSTPESGKNIEKEMSFIEHLEVLRRHVIRATIAVLVFMLISFMFIQDIYKVVLLSPSRVDFWTYKKLCELGKILHIDSLCVKQMNFTLMSREVSGQFMMSITSSAVIGLVFAFPYAFWEIWRFIKPGLSQSERNAARGAVFYVTFLFFLGITFGYFVVTPFALNFS